MSTLSLDAQELLGQLWAKAPSREEKEKLRMAADALRFIASTGVTVHGLGAGLRGKQAGSEPT
jgi:hypothetical protein